MFRRKKPEPEPLHLELSQPVWFILIKVEIIGNSKQRWIAGSTAFVQAFVPARRIEDALDTLDAFLPSQELVRKDTLRANRHDADEEWDELPDNYYREPLEEAARTSECRLGVFVVSQETAWPHSETPQ